MLFSLMIICYNLSTMTQAELLKTSFVVFNKDINPGRRVEGFVLPAC